MLLRLAAFFLIGCVYLPAQGADLVVVEKKSNSVGFYTFDGQRLGGVPVGEHPHEMVLAPDGRTLYVSDNGILWMTEAGEGGNTISIIDVQDRKKIGVIDLGKYRRPHGLALDAATGRLLVTTENPDGLLLVDTKTRKVLRYFEQGVDPHMVLFSRDGEWAYLSSVGDGEVLAIELKSGKATAIPTGNRPQGGALTNDGKILFMTNSESSTISVVDTAAKNVIGEIETNEGVNRIELTPDEKTLVYSMSAAESVGFADVASRRQLATVKLPGSPLSLSLSPDGKTAYSGIQDNDEVAVISVAERKLVKVWKTPKEAGPDPVMALR